MLEVNDDLLDPKIVQNPSPYYKLLREKHPCYWNERWRGWVLTRLATPGLGFRPFRVSPDPDGETVFGTFGQLSRQAG
jgi:hypothetical protein